MNGVINLTSIIMTNFLGILVLLTAVLSCKWFRNHGRSELFDMNGMIVTVVVCCIFDILASFYDGGSSSFAKGVVLIGNTVLFAGTIVNSMFFVLFIGKHMNGDLKKPHKIFVEMICLVAAIVLVINLFQPIVFSINSNNQYIRTSYYYVFMGCCFYLILDGILTYVVAVKKGGVTKYFPIWIFVFPIVLGSVLQSFVYGVSLIWSTSSVSVAGFMVCYSMESIYVDPLTGAYNRRYIDSIVQKLSRKHGKYDISGLVIDINKFKSINDTFGHEIGDEALIRSAKILKNITGNLGSVIRTGGDEFLVILNTQNEEEITEIIEKIRLTLWDSNKSQKYKYFLDFAIGHGNYYPNQESFDEFLTKVDKLMYEDKNVE